MCKYYGMDIAFDLLMQALLIEASCSKLQGIFDRKEGGLF